MKKDILLIDGQLFQTNTWNRGMGKYTLELLKHLSESGYFKTFSRVEVIFNSNVAIEKSRMEVLKDISTNFSFSYIDLSTPLDIHNEKELVKRNKTQLNTHIDATTKTTDDVHFIMPSLFEGDYALPVFPDNNGIKAMIYYDAIPYLFAGQYLGSEKAYKNYIGRFNVLFETDIFFTISQTTHNDLITYFGISPDKVCNIDGAPIQLQRTKIHSQKPKIVTNYEYILLPSGNDIRKNNDWAVRAFEQFNAQYANRYKLLITSTFDDLSKNRLKKLSPNIIFTNNVTENEMHWLYENATIVFFPPLYEGLGLPILEAIEANKPIACSAISVFQEMSNTAFNYFDPLDVDSIVDGLVSALENEVNTKEYKKVEQKYTWERSAQLFEKGMDEYKKVSINTKPKLAIFGPDPSGVSGIGKLMQLLHPSLAQYADVDYYFENNGSDQYKTSYLHAIASTYTVDDFTYERYKQYDAVIYNIGNSDYHCKTFLHSCRYPGYAIFHDTKLDGLLGVLQLAKLMTPERAGLEKKLNAKYKSNRAHYTSSIANNQLGVIAHSNYALGGIKKNTPKNEDKTFNKLSLPVNVPVTTYGSHNKTATIGVAGIISPTKGLSIIEDIASSDEFMQYQFKLFGYGFATNETELIGLRSLPNVEIITDVSDLEFNTLLGQVDVLLNYRPIYNGESSYVTVEGMRNGAVVMVRDIGWFSELPDDSVIKITDEDTIKNELMSVLSDPARLQTISKRAQEVIREHYNLEKYVKDLLGVVIKTEALENRSLQASIQNIIKTEKNKRKASNKIKKIILEME